MANKIKLKGTTENSFEIGLNKQVLDASALTAPRTWTLPDSNGTNGYALTTDGAGNLSWAAGGAASSTPYVPITIAAPDTFTVPTNTQVLYAEPITVIGNLVVNGDLVDVGPLGATGVTAGSYTLTSLTVDALGRITAASSGVPSASGATYDIQRNVSGALFGSTDLVYDTSISTQRLGVADNQPFLATFGANNINPVYNTTAALFIDNTFAGITMKTGNSVYGTTNSTFTFTAGSATDYVSGAVGGGLTFNAGGATNSIGSAVAGGLSFVAGSASCTDPTQIANASLVQIAGGNAEGDYASYGANTLGFSISSGAATLTNGPINTATGSSIEFTQANSPGVLYGVNAIGSSVLITAGVATTVANTGYGGDVKLTSGDGYTATGDVLLQVGSGGAYVGGSIIFSTPNTGGAVTPLNSKQTQFKTTTVINQDGAVAEQSNNFITTGTASTVGEFNINQVFYGMGVTAAYTLTLPTYPVDGRLVTLIMAGTSITAMTYVDPNGYTILNLPAALVDARAYTFQYFYNGGTSFWCVR